MNVQTKKDVRWRCIKRIRLALLILGLCIAVTAWFLEWAAGYPWVLRLVAPDYVVARDAIEILDKGEKETLSLDHPGAQVLLSWWPAQPPAEVLPRLSGIGRSTGVVDLPNAKQFYEIRILADDNALMLSGADVWSNIDVRARMETTLHNATRRWSGVVCALGLFLTAGMALWEHFDK